MFLKATTPTVRDTVIVKDNAGAEIDRFTAVWKRPDSAARRTLLQQRLEGLRQLQQAQEQVGDKALPGDEGLDGFNAALNSIVEQGNARIRMHLASVEGLLDAADAPVDYTPGVLEAMLEWAEYANPLAESLARLAEGRTVEDAQAKNSTPPVGSGQPAAGV